MKVKILNILLLIAAFFAVHSLEAQSPRNIELIGGDKKEVEKEENTSNDRVYKRRTDAKQNSRARARTTSRSQARQEDNNNQGRSTNTCPSWSEREENTTSNREEVRKRKAPSRKGWQKSKKWSFKYKPSPQKKQRVKIVGARSKWYKNQQHPIFVRRADARN